MRVYVPILMSVVLLAAGCSLFCGEEPPPCYSEYHAPSFNLSTVSRVLLMPLANESPFAHAPEEIRTALAAELQCEGRFEVVVAPPHGPEIDDATRVHLVGHFDEAAMVHLARAFNVNAILVGAVTNYHPYWPPRLGLTLQLISPTDAVVVASVDGIWDGRNRRVAREARDYASRFSHPLIHPFQQSDLALESPHLFQGFVASQVAAALTNSAPPRTEVLGMGLELPKP